MAENESPLEKHFSEIYIQLTVLVTTDLEFQINFALQFYLGRKNANNCFYLSKTIKDHLLEEMYVVPLYYKSTLCFQRTGIVLQRTKIHIV